MKSLGANFRALVIGASGGIGHAVADALDNTPNCAEAIKVSRKTHPGFNLTDENSIRDLADELSDKNKPLHLIFDATGALTIDDTGPEKSLAALSPDVMLKAFAVNTIGPALLFKHFSPLLDRNRKSVFATLSARVGSIGDNELGGWYAYRASKAALNQVVKVASIEIARKRPHAVCLALHPGTIETNLTRKYAGGRYTHTPDEAATNLLRVIEECDASHTGSFYAYDGSTIAW